MQQLGKLPGVFAVQRGIILSDAVLYNAVDGQERSPVKVMRHGILGTQNVPDKETDVKNPQRTESAKTEADANGLIVKFSLTTIDLRHSVYACSEPQWKSAVLGFVERYEDSEELRELCRRYARNVLNGRWLWRNRLLGRSITIQATSTKYQKTIEIDALKVPFNSFVEYSQEEQELGRWLHESFAGSTDAVHVRAHLDFGMKGAIEVFPSQNMVMKKPDGFARSLYKLDRMSRSDLLKIVNENEADRYMADMIDMGIAALRDQKIGNAIRTIDTWYEGGNDAAPIPIEPLGANIERNMAMRPAHSANNLFYLLPRVLPTAPQASQFNADAAFVLANLIRGFVGSEKDEKQKTGNDEENGAKKRGRPPKSQKADAEEPQVAAQSDTLF